MMTPSARLIFFEVIEKIRVTMLIKRRIAMSKTDSNDAPLEPVVIDTIRVETFGVDYGEPETIDRE